MSDNEEQQDAEIVLEPVDAPTEVIDEPAPEPEPEPEEE